MKKLCVLSILCIIILACNKKKSVEDLIVGDNGFKFWLNTASMNDSILYFDYFDKNGKWLVFVSENGVFEKHETPDDVVRTEKWYLKNDSTIVIGESSNFNLLRLNKDTMIFNSGIIMITPSKELVPKEYQKLQ